MHTKFPLDFYTKPHYVITPKGRYCDYRHTS